MSIEAYILIGLPGSGKSYWSCEKIKNNKNFVHISKDDIRTMLKSNYNLWEFSLSKEAILFDNLMEDIIEFSIRQSVESKLNLIIDETHITKHYRFLSINKIRLINPNVKINYVIFTENENNLSYRMQDSKNIDVSIWNDVIIKMKNNFEPVTELEFAEFRINKVYTVNREFGEIQIQ